MLAEDSTLDVRRQRGRFAELRVEVDGKSAVTASPFGYPRPSTLVHEVRTWLGEHGALG